MPSDPRQELKAQLHALLGEDEVDSLELAVVAGLLARMDPALPELGAAFTRCAARPAPGLALALDHGLAGLEGVDEDDEPEEAWDALSALDEACAAATFLGRPELARPTVADAVALVHAFPEVWTALAPLASALLERRPPLVGDPAAALWATVEASPALGAEPEGSERLSADLRMEAGLDVVISLFGGSVGPAAIPFPRRQALAAASALPEAAPWVTLRRKDGWELVLTSELDDTPVVLLAGWGDEQPPPAAVDGVAQDWAKSPEGWCTPTRAGTWDLDLDGTPVSFVLR